MKPFKSVLADRLEEFFTYRRQLGFARNPMLSHLKMLDRYLCEQKATADKLQPYFFESVVHLKAFKLAFETVLFFRVLAL